MDLLNDLMGILKEAPQLAIWIFLIIYGFKVVVVGSIYGVIRYVVDRVATSIDRKSIAKDGVALHVVDIVKGDDRVKVIGDAKGDFFRLVSEMRNVRRSAYNFDFIHSSDIEFVRDAIREKQERECK